MSYYVDLSMFPWIIAKVMSSRLEDTPIIQDGVVIISTIAQSRSLLIGVRDRIQTGRVVAGRCDRSAEQGDLSVQSELHDLWTYRLHALSAFEAKFG